MRTEILSSAEESWSNTGRCFIVYHEEDIDGKLSAYIVQRYCIEVKMDRVLIPMNYAKDLDLGDFDYGKDFLVFVDFSLKSEPFQELYDKLESPQKQIHIIDHHKSFLETPFYVDTFSKQSTNNGCGDLDNKFSACYLVFKYFYPSVTIPDWIKLASDYDVWINDDPEYWKTRVMPFQCGLKLEDTDPSSEGCIFDVLRDPKTSAMAVDLLIQHGKIIYDYILKANFEFAQNNAFEIELDGFRGIAVNEHQASLSINDYFDPDRHDFMLTFYFNGEVWKYGIYTEKEGVDCSEIAKKHGGGGHAGASGFSADTFILEVLKDE